MASEKYIVGLSFRGKEVKILQMPRDKTEDGQDNTGWCVWEASNVGLRFVSKEANLRYLLGSNDSTTHCEDAAELAIVPHILDLSAGAGLVSLACASAGWPVTATDVPAQLPQLEYNIEHSGCNKLVTAKKLFWGDDLTTVAPVADASPAGGKLWDVCIASDIVFIALRDHVEAQLQDTLRQAARHCNAVLFVFEERLIREEQEFMEQLGLGATAEQLEADPSLLLVEERKGEDVEVSPESALKGAGGHADTDLWNPGLFWEPPPIRMFILRARPASSM